jgi:hypothetical protein
MTAALHPGPSVLERFSVDDLPAALMAETARHVAGCLSCRHYLDQLAEAKADSLAALPPERFVAQVVSRRDRQAALLVRQRQRQRRRVFGAGIFSVTLAAAAVLVLVARPAPRVSLKGTGVAIHRSRGGEVRLLGADDTIRGGDALRVVLTLPRPNQVSAWFVDKNGRVDPVLPGATSSLAAGEQAFPGSAIVDSPCVDLTLVIAVGAAAGSQTETTLRQAVARGLPAGDDWLPSGALARSLRCE